jgi:4'-phosphopantetheinyl transferase superfamily
MPSRICFHPSSNEMIGPGPDVGCPLMLVFPGQWNRYTSQQPPGNQRHTVSVWRRERSWVFEPFGGFPRVLPCALRSPPMSTSIVGIGVDICQCSRILATYRRFGDRFLSRAYHPSEISEFWSKATSDDAISRFLASRYVDISFSTRLVEWLSRSAGGRRRKPCIKHLARSGCCFRAFR